MRLELDDEKMLAGMILHRDMLQIYPLVPLLSIVDRRRKNDPLVALTVEIIHSSLVPPAETTRSMPTRILPHDVVHDAEADVRSLVQ